MTFSSFVTKTRFFLQLLFFGLAIFFLYSIFVLSASAATYYVATNGSDSSAGTASFPFRTIQKAINVVTAGDVIQVRGGVYSPVIISKSGAQNQPIVLQAYPGERPVIDAASGGTRAIEISSGSTWITIEGFELKNAPQEGIKYYDANNLTIRRNVIHNNTNHGVLGSGGSNVLLDSNIIHNNGLFCQRCIDQNESVNRWHHGAYIDGGKGD